MIEYVLIDKAAEITGLSREAIRALKKKGVLKEDVHWVKRNGRIWIRVENFNAWIRGSLA